MIDSLTTSFLRSRKREVFSTLAAVVVPVVAGAACVAALGYGVVTPDWLLTIPGYDHLTNHLLIVFIALTYLTIFVSLFLYWWDLSGDAFAYRGDNPRRKLLNRTSNLLVIIALISIFIYGLLYAFARTGEMKFDQLIDWNKYFALLCFTIFTLVDYLVWKGKEIDLQELGQGLTRSFRNYKQALHHENTKAICIRSTTLINLPTILIILAIWSLFAFVNAHPQKFEAIYDRDIATQIHTTQIAWSLFLNGVETGVLVASIIFSQLIFAVIKLEFLRRSFEINQLVPKGRHRRPRPLASNNTSSPSNANVVEN